VITGVAFCPQTPLLVPAVAAGAAGELDPLRDACRAAIRRIAVPGSGLVVLGSGSDTTRHEATARGTLAGFGVPIELALGSGGSGPVELPLSLTIAAWLLQDALGSDSDAIGFSIGPKKEEPSRPVLPADSADFALLVMGDGSARRSTSAPGYFDDRAAAFDASVADALRSGEGDRLHLDPGLGEELLAAGTRVWDEAAYLLEPFAFDAELLYDDAPYGVGYFVAAWTRRD
jgi:hypothetical protein